MSPTWTWLLVWLWLAAASIQQSPPTPPLSTPSISTQQQQPQQDNNPSIPPSPTLNNDFDIGGDITTPPSRGRVTSVTATTQTGTVVTTRITTTTTTATDSSATSLDGQFKCQLNCFVPIIAGVVGLFFLLASAVLLMRFRRKKKQQNDQQQQLQNVDKEAGTYHRTQTDSAQIEAEAASFSRAQTLGPAQPLGPAHYTFPQHPFPTSSLDPVQFKNMLPPQSNMMPPQPNMMPLIPLSSAPMQLQQHQQQQQQQQQQIYYPSPSAPINYITTAPQRIPVYHASMWTSNKEAMPPAPSPAVAIEPSLYTEDVLKRANTNYENASEATIEHLARIRSDQQRRQEGPPRPVVGSPTTEVTEVDPIAVPEMSNETRERIKNWVPDPVLTRHPPRSCTNSTTRADENSSSMGAECADDAGAADAGAEDAGASKSGDRKSEEGEHVTDILVPTEMDFPTETGAAATTTDATKYVPIGYLKDGRPVYTLPKT